MKFSSERHGQTLILDLEGELDADGSAEIEERCLYEQQEGALRFVVGLGGLRRITGPGLRVMLGLARSLPGSGGSLVLYGLDPSVEEALRVAGLEGIFVTAPDRAAALRRSTEPQSTANLRKMDRSEASEKIDLAIHLLGSTPFD
jgi:anti-anti-sigma factor